MLALTRALADATDTLAFGALMRGPLVGLTEEELLDITDLDGDIEIDARGGRAYLSVTSSDDNSLRLLSRPDTVNALQELTRIAVQTKTGSFSRLILDVGGSREARANELALLVDKAAERIDGGAASAALAQSDKTIRVMVGVPAGGSLTYTASGAAVVWTEQE